MSVVVLIALSCLSSLLPGHKDYMKYQYPPWPDTDCVGACTPALSYPARYAHAPYRHPWHAPFDNIFPHYLINDAILGEKKKELLNVKCVFSFHLRLLSETILSIRRNKRDMIINVYWFSYIVPVILVRF